MAYVVLGVFAAVATGIGIAVYHDFNNPYTDGYNYASQFSTLGPQLPGCSQYVMINDAHDRNDNYSEWAAGCRAAAGLPNNTGTTGNGNSGNT